MRLASRLVGERRGRTDAASKVLPAAAGIHAQVLDPGLRRMTVATGGA